MGARWIWVANGTRSPAATFSFPRPVVTHAPKAWLSTSVDESTADEFVAELRTQIWDDSSGSLWVDEDEVEDPTDRQEDLDTEFSVGSLHETIEVRVIGPVEVSEWRHPPERAVVVELACYLALHPHRPIPGDELRLAIWPDDVREASAKSLRTYMSLLRKAIGSEHFPVGSAAGYKFSDTVVSDWTRFNSLARPAATLNQLRDALELVRGRPFTGVPAHSFGWVFSELLVSHMEVAISEVARRLTSELMKIDELADATWAILQGLRAVPSDFGLWELRLSIADRQGATELARARRDAEVTLGVDVSELFGRP